MALFLERYGGRVKYGKAWKNNQAYNNNARETMDRSGVGGSTGSTHQHAKSLPASPPPAPSVCLMMVIMIIMMLSAIERRYLI